jgi:hypothetical protein
VSDIFRFGRKWVERSDLGAVKESIMSKQDIIEAVEAVRGSVDAIAVRIAIQDLVEPDEIKCNDEFALALEKLALANHQWHKFKRAKKRADARERRAHASNPSNAH